MSDVLLSRYKILRNLSSGGFGDTYLAQDLALPGHPSCVVKHLQPKNADPAALAIAKTLFEREAECLYRLGEHDQIPRLYAHFQEGGEFYLVQEFVDGNELSQEILPGKPWSEEQTIQLLQDILEVLAVVHQENVIHRDLKPSNIMRRKRDGKLVLIDFGAVREIGALTVTSGRQTSITVAIGTPGYMPSEQAQGKPRLASDIYAVGMIGIQVVTGVMPSQFPEDPATGQIIWRDRANISDRLADILDKMIHEYYRSRYQDASQALKALMFIEGSSTPLSSMSTVIAQKVSTQSQDISKPFKLLPWVVVSGLTVGTITGITAINRLSFSPPSIFPSSPTISPTATATPTPTFTPTPLETPSPTPTPEVTIPPIEIPKPEPIITPTPTPTPTPTLTPTSSAGVAIVFDPPSYVRTAPTPTGSILCPVRSVRTINIYESTDGWYKTDVCGSPGYIYQSQITFNATSSKQVATVFDPPSNVRTNPNGDILCSVRSVKTIDVYRSKDGWYQTDVCGSMGYIHSSQIRF
jgi:serine/threonine-protein kinase